MKKSYLKAAALALAFSPSAINAEILSQKRLAEILASNAPGPVDVETMYSRDRDLLVSLGVTLRDKYGSILDGSEVIFTRMERAGRIVYRMDFINVKTQDHANGICEILEMENCVILSEDGSANLISAELDEDGLMSLDAFVPFSGAVRMEKLPTVEPSEVSKEILKNMRLPIERPSIEESQSTEDQSDMDAETGQDAEASTAPKKSSYRTLPTMRPNADALGAKLAMALPMARPSSDQLLPEMKMALPVPRPTFSDSTSQFAAMALPSARPVAEFGLQDHLPRPRAEAFDMAEFEEELSLPAEMSFISGGYDSVPLIGSTGFEVSIANITAGLEGLSLDTLDDVPVEIHGFGTAFLGDTLPVFGIDVPENEAPISAVIQATDTGIEMELNGGSVDTLPKTFVLSFAEDGVKAIANPVVTSSSKEFEIASVVMTDAFSRPFDIVGNGSPDLQKLPKTRPDMSMFETGFEMVSATDSEVLLARLFERPVEVAQVPGAGQSDSPGDILLKRLTTMEADAGIFPTDLSEAGASSRDDEAAEKAHAAKPVKTASPEPATAEQQKLVTPDAVVEPQEVLPKSEDGLVDLAAIEEDSQEQVLGVLSQISKGESQTRGESQARMVAGPAPVQKLRQQNVPQVAYRAEPQPDHREAAPFQTQPSAKQDTRGIFDVANYRKSLPEVQSNPDLRIELSYVSSRDQVGSRAKELEAFIPDVIMKKGRFYGFRVPNAPSTYIIGIEARDLKARDDIIWYLEAMRIPWAIRAAVD